MLDIAAFVMFVVGLIMLASTGAAVAGWISATPLGTALLTILGIVFITVSGSVMYTCLFIKANYPQNTNTCDKPTQK